ncbi:hypothetical protein MVEN_02440200 [Mycena venus]|uniref:F-box domain-containing protein n=1 Tax=Mycena venus TaxID=2733690 RepID=A0A8H7CB89_9AGAR|nr:hypothetical protein MVEN_02440200 [Mycena venus]
MAKRSKTRSAAQLLSPILRDPVLVQLPFELSSKIFVHCLPPRPEPGSSHIPMLLLNVCRARSDIALSTPALWAIIHVVFPRGKHFTELLETWLRRTGGYPLSVSLHKVFEKDVAALVGTHARQLKNLEISHDGSHPRLWASIISGPLPFLATLTLTCIKQTISLNVRKILEILRYAPNLVECTFDWVVLEDKKLTSAEKLVLPGLQRLYFTRKNAERNYYGWDLEGDGSLLTYLTLPPPSKHSYSRLSTFLTLFHFWFDRHRHSKSCCS